MNYLRLSLGLILAVSFCTQAQEVTKTSKLTIKVVDGSGSYNTTGTLILLGRDGNVVYSGTPGAKPMTFTLSHGDYTARIEATGHEAILRDMSLGDDDQIVTIVSPFSDRVCIEDCFSFQYNVAAKAVPAASCTINETISLKLIGIFSGYSKEVPISAYGYALFRSVEPGPHVILAIEGNRVRAVKSFVTNAQTTNVNLMLESCEKVLP